VNGIYVEETEEAYWKLFSIYRKRTCPIAFKKISAFIMMNSGNYWSWSREKLP
jgi:hypothetical protein